MKKILFLVAVLTAMLALSACGGGNGDAPAPVPGGTPTPGPNVAPTPAPIQPPEEAPGAGMRPDAALNTTTVPRPGITLVNAEGYLLTRDEILALVPGDAPSGEVVIGVTTAPTANWMAGWDTTSPNVQARTLLHGGRDTVIIDRVGSFSVNQMVVREYDIRDNADGSRTYTLTIYTDNLWSDGTPITAQDYVFGFMMRSSPEFAGIGGSTTAGNDHLGFREFRDGDTRHFAGVRLYSDETFSLTVPAEGLPYIWEILYMSVGPEPMHDLAPGVSIIDSPEGARFCDNFTQDLLQETINDPETGARFFPRVFAGPYVLRSYDAGAHTLIMDVNPNFNAFFDGHRPRVQTWVKTWVDQEVIMDALRIGQIDMVHAMRQGRIIQAGHDVVNDLGQHRISTFPRNGFGYLSFHSDFGPAQFKEVRQAVGFLMDRMTIAHMFTGGWGFVQHGWYALSSFEFDARGAELYNHPDFIYYTFNPAVAVQILEDGGWYLNAAGNPFVPGTDAVRHKLVDGELMPLEMQWASNDNLVSEILRTELLPHAAGVGMIINEHFFTSPASNIPHWQRREDQGFEQGVFNIFTLATGLGSPFTPWFGWSMYPEFQTPGFNTTGMGGEDGWALHNLSQEMRFIDASQEGWSDKYLDLWVQWQLLYNQLMPIIPLYADEDHDFVALWLGNWDSDGVWDFRHAASRAYVAR